MTRIVMVFDRLVDGDMLTQAGDVLRQSYEEGHQLLAVIPAIAGVSEQLQQSIDLGSYERTQNKLLSIHSTLARRMVRTQQDRSLLIHDMDDMLGSYAWMGRAMINRQATAAEAAAILATGERLSARLLTAYLQHEGIRATTVNSQEVIASAGDILAAIPDAAATASQCRSKIAPLLSNRTVVIMGGGSGGTAEGQVTRIQADKLSAAYSLLAASCEAGGLWLMQQRSGLMIADPEEVPEAQSIPVLPLSSAGRPGPLWPRAAPGPGAGPGSARPYSNLHPQYEQTGASGHVYPSRSGPRERGRHRGPEEYAPAQPGGGELQSRWYSEGPGPISCVVERGKLSDSA